MYDLTTRYKVRPSLNLVAHSADVVELRRGVWNPISITLTDRSGSGKLFRALEMMTGEATLGEIAERTHLTGDEAKSLIAFLSCHNAIETAAGSAFEFQLELYRETLGNGTAKGLNFDRALLLGGSEVVNDISEQLQGFGDSLSTQLVEADLLEELTGKDYTLIDDPLAFRNDIAKFAAWKGSLLVVASPTIHPILLRNINRICLHHGIPWIHSVADGPFLIVGPTFIPKRSSCYECFELRVTISMRESGSYLRYKQALTNRMIKLGRASLGRPFQGVLASLTALEVANFAATGSNFTVGKALTIFLPTMEFSFNEVLRAPSCPGCSPLTEQHEQGLYFDLKGYVNSIYNSGHNGGNGKG
jgi:bacteriocin biosynthesis cyclodehydratase domain-containing protein